MDPSEAKDRKVDTRLFGQLVKLVSSLILTGPEQEAQQLERNRAIGFVGTVAAGHGKTPLSPKPIGFGWRRADVARYPLQSSR